MSDLPVNGARGEVALRIGGVPLVIAAEMERLAQLSTALGSPSLGEFQRRLSSLEIFAVLAAVRHLAIQGDVDEAVAALSLGDFPEIARAIAEALSHHFKDRSGKGQAATEAAATTKTKASDSGNG